MSRWGIGAEKDVLLQLSKSITRRKEQERWQNGRRKDGCRGQMMYENDESVVVVENQEG
jgi:hypothetical protein